MDSIGLRELRQNASKYLRRVEHGETIEVTNRGRPVARLAPVPNAESVLDRLIAAGKATRATRRVSDLPPPLPGKEGERPLSEVLDEMREDRI